MTIERADIAAATPNTAFAEARMRDGAPQFTGLPSANFGTRVPGQVPESGQGIFARWNWDGTTLSAEVDPYGFFSLFYCIDGDRLMLSPSLLELAARGCPLKRDRRALAVFHRLGIFINDDTPFEDIKVLPPGGKLTWQGGRVTLDVAAPAVKPNNISRAEAVDGFIDLFRQSVKRTLDAWDGSIVLPLSGGRDSRHILLELVRQGRRPDACVTFQHSGAQWNAEVKAARAICEAVGVRHDVLGHMRSRQIDNLRAIALTELCADEHAQMMPLHDYLIGRRAATYDGIAGDVLTEGGEDPERCHKLFLAGDHAAIARAMMEGHGRIISATNDPRGASALYSPSREEHEAAVEYVARSIAGFSDWPDPNQVFWLLNRTRREISFVARGILAPAQAVFAPYLDRDLVDFTLGLPFEIKLGPHLHDEIMQKAYPDVAHVPFEEGFRNDPPRPSSIGHKLQSAIDMAKVAQFLAPGAPLAEYRALLGRGRTLGRGPNEMYHLHDRLVESLTPTRAKEILAFARQLEEGRPRELISDSFLPLGKLH